MRLPLVPTVLIALLTFAGCDGTGRAGAADPARVAADSLAWHGAVEAVAVKMTVRVKQPERDALRFDVNAWAAADGRVRVNLAKYGFDGMDALVAADGEFDLLLPRSDESFHGWMHEFLPEGARMDRANLVLMTEEWKRGPLAAVPAYEGEGRTLRYRDPASGFNAVVELDPRTPAVKTKTLVADDGRELCRFTYANYLHFDEDRVWRPMSMKLQFLQTGVEANVRVESDGGFDVVPTVSGDRMSLTIPDGTRKLSFDEFLHRLGG